MAYETASGHADLTEELTLEQLEHFLRLRRKGLRLEYYLMGKFWDDRHGGHRIWRKKGWPNGANTWLRKCVENNVKPGLWLCGNTLGRLEPLPEWNDSLNWPLTAMCLFEGGYLDHFLRTLEFWHHRGVRLFKIDGMDFSAATFEMEKVMLPTEIWMANCAAFSEALRNFRAVHQDVVLIAGNGFAQKPVEEYPVSPGENPPFRKYGDSRWLEVFAAQSVCEPEPSRSPLANFWRSLEVRTDQKIAEWQANGFPLTRLLNSGFSIGDSETIFYRKTEAWKSAALLALSRGGWANLYQGDLALIDGEQVDWLVAVQNVYFSLQKGARLFAFGGMPETGAAYGYAAVNLHGAWLTVVNSSQDFVEIPIPLEAFVDTENTMARVHFCDTGFLPVIENGCIRLGPEQMALVGIGKLAGEEYEMGFEEDVKIPLQTDSLKAEFEEFSGRLRALVRNPPETGTVRVLIRQFDAISGRVYFRKEAPARSLLAKQKDENVNASIRAMQNGREIPVRILRGANSCGWTVGELDLTEETAGEPLMIEYFTPEHGVVLRGDVYAVSY